MRGHSLDRPTSPTRPPLRSFRIVDCCVMMILESKSHSMRPTQMDLACNQRPYTTFICLRWREASLCSDSSNLRSKSGPSTFLLLTSMLINNSVKSKAMILLRRRMGLSVIFKRTLRIRVLLGCSLLVRTKFWFGLKIWQTTLMQKKIRKSRVRALTLSMLKSLQVIYTRVWTEWSLTLSKLLRWMCRGCIPKQQSLCGEVPASNSLVPRARK